MVYKLSDLDMLVLQYERKLMNTISLQTQANSLLWVSREALWNSMHDLHKEVDDVCLVDDWAVPLHEQKNWMLEKTKD